MNTENNEEENNGSFIPALVGFVVILFVCIFICYTLVGTINTEIETTFNNESWPVEFGRGPDIAHVFIIVFIAAIGLVAALMLPGSAEETEEEIAEAKPIKNYTLEEKKTRKTAMQIIRERYAKGEITKEEYTEFMARL